MRSDFDSPFRVHERTRPSSAIYLCNEVDASSRSAVVFLRRADAIHPYVPLLCFLTGRRGGRPLLMLLLSRLPCVKKSCVRMDFPPKESICWQRTRVCNSVSMQSALFPEQWKRHLILYLLAYNTNYAVHHLSQTIPSIHSRLDLRRLYINQICKDWYPASLHSYNRLFLSLLFL